MSERAERDGPRGIHPAHALWMVPWAVIPGVIMEWTEVQRFAPPETAPVLDLELLGLAALGGFLLCPGLAAVGFAIAVAGHWAPAIPRRTRLFALLAAVLGLVCPQATYHVTHRTLGYERARDEAVARVIRNGDPIVDALARHKRDHAVYPDTLDSLAPMYLAETPDTGVAGAPNYWYSRTEDSGYREYELLVCIPRFFLTSTDLVFRSDGDYSERAGYRKFHRPTQIEGWWVADWAD